MEAPTAKDEAGRDTAGEGHDLRAGDQSLSERGLHHFEDSLDKKPSGGERDSAAELRSGSKPVEPEWASMRRHWYSQTYVLLELVKGLSNKETAFLEKLPSGLNRVPRVIRCCNCWSVDLLKNHFDAFRVLDSPYLNIYFSLMDINQMPMFSYAPPERKQQYAAWTDGGYKTHFGGFDLAFDIDAKTIPEAQQCIIKLKALFDQFKVPSIISFSGSRGFHLRVRSKWLPQLPEDTIVPMFQELTHRIKVIDNLPDIDDSICDSRRIFKCLYSFDRGKICLPLSDDQIEHFDLKMVEPAQVLHSIQIKNRGTLERFSDLSQEQAVANFWKLAKNFIDVKKYGGKPDENQTRKRRTNERAA